MADGIQNPVHLHREVPVPARVQPQLVLPALEVRLQEVIADRQPVAEVPNPRHRELGAPLAGVEDAQADAESKDSLQLENDRLKDEIATLRAENARLRSL